MTPTKSTTGPGKAQLVAWRLPSDLVARIKAYRHAEQIETITEATRRLLANALDQWDEQRRRSDA